MTQSTLILDTIESTLKELGIPLPDSFIRTILLRDRCLVGEKYRFDGGYAIWLMDQKRIEIFDHKDQPLMSVPVTAGREVA